MYKRLIIILCCLMLLILACTHVEDTSEEKTEELIPDPVCIENEQKFHECDDGTKVEWCTCDVEANDWVCINSPETACPEEPAVEETINLSEIEYTLKPGESVMVDGKEVKFEKYFDRQLIEVSVDGIKGRLIPTKNIEIINGYEVYLTYVLFKGSTHPDNYITLYAFPYNFGENEYLIERLETQTIEGYDITLKESHSNDYIRVTAVVEDTNVGDTATIYEGESATIDNVTIKNIDGFWQYEQYALVEITSP